MNVNTERVWRLYETESVFEKWEHGKPCGSSQRKRQEEAQML